MAKVVDTLVLNHFELIKAIGLTLHNSELTFTISGNGKWCSIDDGWIALPEGVTLPGGAKYAWLEYTRNIYSSLTVNVFWDFAGLSEDAYYKKKEELAKEEESEGGSGEETDPNAPVLPDITPDLPDIIIPDAPEIDDSEYTFDPEFIEFPDPFTGKT